MQQLEFMSTAPERLFRTEGLEQRGRTVSGRMLLGGWAAGPGGGISVGALGVLVDEVLGYALMASLAEGSWSLSTEIWIDVVGVLARPHGVLTACAEVVQAGSFSTGEVRDGAGRLVATCRQRGRLTSRPAGAPVTVGQASVQPRPGDLEALLGLRPEGGVHVLQTRPDLVNPLQVLHGGVSLAASEVVATRSRQEHGCELPTTSVHIVHTRGVPLGEPLVLRAETRHVGRTLWVTDVEGTVGGRTSTVATVTAQT